MSRHPYTHAADFVRSHAGGEEIHVGGSSFTSPALSRSDASHLIGQIAQAIGWTKEELAIKLSEAHQRANEDEG